MQNAKIDYHKLARRLVQIIFVCIVLYAAVGRQLHLKVPTVDALCPFGAFEGIWHLITSGRYLGKIFPSNMVIGAALVLSVLIAGGAFCGWVCPFGTLQDGIDRLRRLTKIPAFKIPHRIEKYLTGMRFVVLFGILFLTIRTTELVFSSICPYRTIFSVGWFFSPSAGDWAAYVIAGAIIVFSLFVTRAWCRFLCPLGAVISVLSKFSLVKINRREETCIDCSQCEKACPMNLEPQAGKHPSSSCTLCLECSQSCPRPRTLEPDFPMQAAKLNKVTRWVPMFTVLVFASVIMFGNIYGYWETTGKSAGFYEAAVIGERMDPEDIRGWMSIEQVSAVTGVPVDHILITAGISQEIDPGTPLNELEKTTHVDTDDIRKIVEQFYKDNPDDTSLNIDGVSIDRPGRGNIDSDEIRGRSTIDQVCQLYDIPRDWLLDKLNLPSDTPGSTTLRTLGIEISTVIAAAQEYDSN